MAPKLEIGSTEIFNNDGEAPASPGRLRRRGDRPQRHDRSVCRHPAPGRPAPSARPGGEARHERRARGILPHRRPEEPLTVVRTWLEVHERITSGGQARFAGITQTGALNQLERLVTYGYLVRGKGAGGRNAHFLAGPRLPGQDP